MIKILFICLGNICRSPMAEFVLKDMLRKEGLADRFLVESAGTSAEEYGNPVYPPARRILAKHGISCSGKYARRMTAEDYERYDMLIGMEQMNLRAMRRFIKGDPEGKISLLMDYTNRPGDVADPYYSGDFEATWRDVWEGCAGLVEYLKSRGDQ